jgi:acetyl-CoA acyltransferase
MREAVVVASARTPLAKSFRGSFNLTSPVDLVAHSIKSALAKVPQLDTAEIEDLILGCGYPCGAQGQNVARVAAILAGLPVSVAGLTINRFCSSGLQSIALAANHIINDGADVMLAGGVESITMLGRDTQPHPVVKEMKPGIYMVMGDTAEVVAKRYGVSREAQDEYSLESQLRTARAQAEGFFKEEIAPIQVTRGILDKKTGEVIGKEEHLCEGDECNRPDTTLEGLLALKPHFDKDSGQGSVTAGNSSQTSDGAAAALVMSREKAESLGLQPMARFVAFATGGVAPEEMGIGPVVAIPKVLKIAGLKLEDIDLIELNEAFAAQALSVIKVLNLHPLGCTGAKLTATLLYEMKRRKARYGMVTMCVGGGMGAAGIFENLMR